jgi:hypothetical protein
LAPELKSIPDGKYLSEIWRYLAGVQSFNGQRDPWILWCRGDGVTALRLVPVLGGQPHVHVLASAMARPVWNIEDDRPRRRRFHDDVDDGGKLPDDGRCAGRRGH